MIKYMTDLNTHLVRRHGESLDANSASTSNNNKQEKDSYLRRCHHNLTGSKTITASIGHLCSKRYMILQRC